jgi:hypothetical protein
MTDLIAEKYGKYLGRLLGVDLISFCNFQGELCTTLLNISGEFMLS